MTFIFSTHRRDSLIDELMCHARVMQGRAADDDVPDNHDDSDERQSHYVPHTTAFCMHSMPPDLEQRRRARAADAGPG